MLLGATIGTHDHVYKWQMANIDVQARWGGGQDDIHQAQGI